MVYLVRLVLEAWFGGSKVRPGYCQTFELEICTHTREHHITHETENGVRLQIRTASGVAGLCPYRVTKADCICSWAMAAMNLHFANFSKDRRMASSQSSFLSSEAS